jgi:hypothetical protein
MSDKKNSLGGYMSGTPYPTPPKRELPHTVPKKTPYKAVISFRAGEKQERFRIIQKSGELDFYGYSHILEGSLKGDLLTLSMTSRTFLISGKNLVGIIDALSDRKAKALQAFNPDIHLAISDPQEIIIESIEREES